ncbi:MAG: putative ABC transporter permease [Clostridia bacterium]|nr:putative ABC transporter permease [Clostridia bacterium]
MEKVDKKETHLISMRYLLLYFLIYAIIGWLLETAYAFATLGHFVKRGFLCGPLCPIYGWGAVILIHCLKKYKSKPVKLFFYSAIVFSVFEYVAGFALDALFSARWWDYTNDFMNLNGRISIFFSFAWGIIALIFIHFVHPLVEKMVKKIVKKIPTNIQIIFINIAFLILIVDTILSSIRYLNLF